MSVTSIKDLVFDLSRKEQIQLAMQILQNIADEESGENEWLTDEVEAEPFRRKEAALNGTSQLLSHDEVMKSIRK